MTVTYQQLRIEWPLLKLCHCTTSSYTLPVGSRLTHLPFFHSWEPACRCSSRGNLHSGGTGIESGSSGSQVFPLSCTPEPSGCRSNPAKFEDTPGQTRWPLAGTTTAEARSEAWTSTGRWVLLHRVFPGKRRRSLVLGGLAGDRCAGLSLHPVLSWQSDSARPTMTSTRGTSKSTRTLSSASWREETLNGNKKHKTTSQEFIFSFGGASISPRPETDYRMKKLLKNRKTQTLSSNKTKQKKKDSSIFAQNQQQRQRQQQHQHMTKADELMTASNKEGLQLLLLRLLHLLLRFLKTVWAAAGTNFFDTTASTENISFSFSTDDQNVTFDFGKKSTEARAAAAARNSGPPINIHMHQKNQGEKGALSHATCTKDARY